VFGLFDESCADLSDYDLLHQANLNHGWEYLGTKDPPTKSLINAVSEKYSRDAGASDNTKTQQMGRLFGILSPLMGALMSEGEHRRVYAREIGGQEHQLIQTYRPAVEGYRDAQVNCTLHAVAPDGGPSNDELVNWRGRKPDYKTNFERKVGKPVAQRWEGGKKTINFSFLPSGIQFDSDPKSSQHHGIVSLTKAEVIKVIPKNGDPEPPAVAAATQTEPPDPASHSDAQNSNPERTP
jgi:hypothetical protein